MRMTEGVEWAAHCATLLATLPAEAALPAARLAEFHGVPAPYLAKTLQALTRAGIVASSTGRAGGYRLGRPAEDITLLDVVRAVEGPEPFFRCTEIRRRGPAGVDAAAYRPLCGIAAVMGRAQQAWEGELEGTTVADIAALVMAEAPEAAIGKSVVWLTGVLGGRGGPPSG